MKLHTCTNPGCGKLFKPGAHTRFCSDVCLRAADRKRRRAKRQLRNLATPPALAGVCECFDCEVTFLADEHTLTEHESCSWQIKPADKPGCAECGRTPATVDGRFCSDQCFTAFWSRIIARGERLNVQDIVWTEQFQRSLIPYAAGA